MHLLNSLWSILARRHFRGAHMPYQATNNVRILPGTHLYTWVESSIVDKVSCWRTKSARHWRESNPQPFDPESRIQSNTPRHLQLCVMNGVFIVIQPSVMQRVRKTVLIPRSWLWRPLEINAYAYNIVYKILTMKWRISNDAYIEVYYNELVKLNLIKIMIHYERGSCMILMCDVK